MTAAGTDDRETSSEETTLVDEEWPVAEQYRVEPTETPGDAERGKEEETATVLVQGPVAEPRRRPLPPFLRDEKAAGLVVALILALALAALTGWFLTKDEASGTTTPVEQPTGTGTTTDDTTTTPTTGATRNMLDVTAATLAEAREVLEEAGFRVRVRRTASDEQAGRVLSQLPAPGSDITENGIVTLTVSGGPSRVTVPNVVGESASAASRKLEEAGLQVEIERIASSRPNGTVIRQSPEAGAELEDGGLVSLQVAKPRPTPQTVGVPRLTGLDVSSARARVRELGLRSTVTRVESNEPEGTVVAQDPSSGTALERGGTVALSVSSGPASVPVPDVVGIDEGSARSQLESAGFEVRTIDEPTDDPTQDGVVVGQSPVGGAERKPGTVVTVRVARLA